MPVPHSDPERFVEDPALGLSCNIYGLAPVQAEGRIDGHPLYFRARHDAWSFTVCTSHDIDAAAIHPMSDEPGFFQMDEFRGYYLSGAYGRTQEASYMRYDESERLIRECASRFSVDVSTE